ncbi:MAG: ankyrin repeat domain-containing protein [Bacteroidetes bacterium]|nr:ankyrin repeat domain-containing protein [Bacteroidota bacterium]
MQRLHSRDLKTIKELAKNKPLINQIFSDGSNLMHFAVQLGFNEVVEALINNDVNPNLFNSSDSSPLTISIIKNDTYMAEKLLKTNKINIYNCDFNGYNYFHVACFMRRLEIMEIILKYDNEINNNSIVLSETNGDLPIDILIYSLIKSLKKVKIDNELLDNIIIKDECITKIINYAFNRNMNLSLLSRKCNIILFNDRSKISIKNLFTQKEIDDFLKFY